METDTMINKGSEDVELSKKTSSKSREVDVDEYLEYVGPSGRFQVLLVLLFCFIIVAPTYQSLIMSFVGSNPPWRCNPPYVANTTTNSTCQIEGLITSSHAKYAHRCDMFRSEWEFSKPKDFSIVTEWDLICENNYLAHLANSALFIGWAFGAIVLGCISDRFGRKSVLFPSWTVLVLTSFASGFANSIGLFIFFRVIIGFSQGGVGLTLYIMASELVGPKYRSLAGTTVWFAFTLALCLMGLQAWLVPKWETLEIIASIPYIILLVSYKFVPESVRWLRVNNKMKEATEVLHRVARFNKVAVIGDITLSAPPQATSGKRVSMIDLFRPSHIAVATLIQCFAWFVNGQVYYGISLASDQLGGNMYRDFILTSLVEIPANILVIYCTNRFGRKPSTVYSMIVGGLACIGVAFIPSYGAYNAVRVTLGMLGKLCITVSFNSIYVWSVELFPTIVRSQGMGLLSVISRIGAASAPWVAQFLRNVHDVLPFTIMGGLTLLSAFLCFKLNETLGMATAETLDQMSATTNQTKDNELHEMKNVTDQQKPVST